MSNKGADNQIANLIAKSNLHTTYCPPLWNDSLLIHFIESIHYLHDKKVSLFVWQKRDFFSDFVERSLHNFICRFRKFYVKLTHYCKFLYKKVSFDYFMKEKKGLSRKSVFLTFWSLFFIIILKK